MTNYFVGVRTSLEYINDINEKVVIFFTFFCSSNLKFPRNDHNLRHWSHFLKQKQKNSNKKPT